MYGEISRVEPVVVDHEKVRAEKLRIMLEANYDESQKYQKLKAEVYITQDPGGELKSQIAAIEKDLLAKYPDFVANQNKFPHAFTRQGSFSN
jgi:hypothetical protein